MISQLQKYKPKTSKMISLKKLRENKCQPSILYQMKSALKTKTEIKIFPNIAKLRECATSSN